MKGSATLSALLLIAVIAPVAAWAAQAESAGTLVIVQENDAFYNTDRHYTNGLKLTWIPGDAVAAPAWAVKLVGLMPWLPEPGELYHDYTIGQSIFTPADISLAEPLADDRPYAGWLYGSVGLGVESGRQLDLLVLTVGMVGPASLAEQTQEVFHEIIGDAKAAQGWDTQLANEPGFVASYQRSWRGLAGMSLNNYQLDFTPHIGIALGNIYTYANAGLTLRYGRRLPDDYGPPRIQPGLSSPGNFTTQADFTWYLFAGVEGRAVARNIFLDGNTFSDSRSVDRYPFVSDLQLGVVMSWQKLRFNYSYVSRTREFRGQDDKDNFGVINISIKF